MTLDYLLVASSAPDVTARFGALDAAVAARSHIAGGTVQHLSPRPGLFVLTVDDAATPVDLRSSHFTVFDGIALIGGSLVRRSADIPPAAEVAWARGNFMLARHAGDEVLISADVLGGYPVFVYDTGGVFCASNNVFLLEAALARLDVRPTASLDLYAYLVTLGNGALDLTGFREVRLLEPGATVTIRRDNRAVVTRADLRDLIESNRPVSELVDEAADDVVTAVRAIAGAPFATRVCDLTGGFDSRMVLAAILHEGRADDFVFFTGGNPPDPDTTVAALIRQRYRLRRATGVERSVPGMGVFESMRHFFTRSSGCFSMFHGTGGVGQPDQRDVAHIGGGFGGLSRVIYGGTYGPTPKGDRWRRDAPLNRYLRSTGIKAERVLAAAGVEGHLGALAAHGQALLASGVPPEGVLDVFYLRNRLRYHFGSRWRVASFTRAAFHPLYSVAAIRGGFAMSFADRKANRFGYELMARLCPSLTKIPFADKSWDVSLGIADVPSPVTRDSPAVETRDEPSVALDGGASSVAPARSAALRAEGRNDKWIDFETALEEFRADVASTEGFDRMAPTFDVAKVRAFLERPAAEFAQRNDAWTGYRLMAAYMWANRLEAHAGAR